MSEVGQHCDYHEQCPRLGSLLCPSVRDVEMLLAWESGRRLTNLAKFSCRRSSNRPSHAAVIRSPLCLLRIMHALPGVVAILHPAMAQEARCLYACSNVEKGSRSLQIQGVKRAKDCFDTLLQRRYRTCHVTIATRWISSFGPTRTGILGRTPAARAMCGN